MCLQVLQESICSQQVAGTFPDSWGFRSSRHLKPCGNGTLLGKHFRLIHHHNRLAYRSARCRWCIGHLSKGNCLFHLKIWDKINCKFQNIVTICSGPTNRVNMLTFRTSFCPTDEGKQRLARTQSPGLVGVGRGSSNTLAFSRIRLIHLPETFLLEKECVVHKRSRREQTTTQIKHGSLII